MCQMIYFISPKAYLRSLPSLSVSTRCPSGCMSFIITVLGKNRQLNHIIDAFRSPVWYR